MTRPNQHALAKLQSIRKLKADQILLRITVEESRLRGELAKLNEHRFQSYAADPALLDMKRIGSDILWQKWLSNTQADLTMDLSKLLAQKALATKAAAKEYGRHCAADRLSKEARAEAEKLRAKKELDALTALSIISKPR